MREGAKLIFDWPGRHNLQLVLPVTLVLAALAHGLVFFVFSIVYPNTVGDGPDPTEVYVALPGSADAARLLDLTALEDPTIFAPGRGDRVGPAVSARYQPSYAVAVPTPEALPRTELLPSAGSLALGPVVIPGSEPGAKTTTPLPTRVTGTGNLADRVPAQPDGTRFSTARTTPAEPTRFLAAVRPDGSVAHVFLESGSGHADLDAQATEFLERSTFLPGGTALVWGDVVFEWGDDISGKGDL